MEKEGENTGAANSDHSIRNAFSCEYTRYTHPTGQNQRKRYQQNDLTQQGYEYGYFGLTQCHIAAHDTAIQPQIPPIQP